MDICTTMQHGCTDSDLSLGHLPAKRGNRTGFGATGRRDTGRGWLVLRNELLLAAGLTPVLRNGRCMHRPYRIGFAAFGADFYERVQGPIEGALMSSLVAHEEGELVRVDACFGEGLIL